MRTGQRQIEDNSDVARALCRLKPTFPCGPILVCIDSGFSSALYTHAKPSVSEWLQVDVLSLAVSIFVLVEHVRARFGLSAGTMAFAS